MNNCTKFAPLWMKFTDISIPTGPQADDPPLPFTFQCYPSSIYDIYTTEGIISYIFFGKINNGRIYLPEK